MPKTLLAKSLTHGKLSLAQHLIDTETAALAIFKMRLLLNWCRFFRLENTDKFLIHLRIAALFHDIGKANAEFYAAVTGGSKKQALRHEWFSALILHLPSVRNWLEPSGLDLEVITAAVLCHHLQAPPDKWGKPRTQVKPGDSIELYLDYDKYPEVKEIFQRIAEIAGVKGLPQLPDKWVAGDNFWEQIYQAVNDAGDDFSIDIKYAPEERRSLLLAVKAGLIAADSVASGIFRTKGSHAIEQWIDDTLHQQLAITEEEIEAKILQPRYRQIEKRSKKPFELKAFQEKAQEQGDRLLLLSGCGTGKTIFGYKWSQSVVTSYQVGHIIFLYPTRGTATEGFKDYVSWAPESDASLLTGTATYELQGMAENPTESTKDKDFTTDERLFALGFWSKRFFSATVDQFLSFLTHNYKSLCLLPVLVDSVVVIDEVHSFSREMFDNLVSFLKHFDIPVLCMTATLPESRRQELAERLKLKVFSSVADRELEVLEKRPRYIVQPTDLTIVHQEAIAAYNDGKGKSVLWVVNTVDRCRQIAALLKEEAGIEALIYHSRFTLTDRKDRHDETVAAFAFKKEGRTPKVAVTTQVCEMSLDLDADVLITELAPISSLVQRFGRCNRSPDRPSKFRAQVWVYEPPKAKPYEEKELNAARKFISEVSGEVSPSYLAEKLILHSPSERFADGGSSFVDSGYWAISEPFRGDEEDYSVNAVLDSNLDDVKKLIEQKQPYDGYILPVPKRPQFFIPNEDRPEWLPSYMAVANHHFYDSKRGFGA